MIKPSPPHGGGFFLRRWPPKGDGKSVDSAKVQSAVKLGNFQRAPKILKKELEHHPPPMVEWVLHHKGLRCIQHGTEPTTLAEPLPISTFPLPLLAQNSDDDRPPISEWQGDWLLAQCPLGWRLMDTIEEQLEQKGVYCYIPRQKLWQERRGKREAAYRPLFPGYIPVCLPEFDLRYAVYSTAHVYRPIHIINQKRFVTELEAIQAMIAAGEVEAFPELVVGRKVRIVRGALMGKEGVLEERGEHQRFVVRATDMMMSAAIEIDARDLEAL